MSRWLGLDITDTAVRVALLRSTYRKTRLEALREERVADHETQSAALRAAMQGLRADMAATAIAGHRAFVRFVSLPAAAQRELSNVLSFEVESTLPLELEDAVMDHSILTRIPELDAQGQLPIIAGVAYTEEVRDRIGLVLRGTGIEPQRVGVGPLPLANLVAITPELARDTPVAILEIGEHRADLVVLRGGEPRFVRSLSRGIAGFPEESGALARELRQTVGAWRMQGGAKLDHLFLVGLGRDMPGLADYLQTQLGLTVTDLPKPALEGVTPDQVELLPRFAKAISLALSLARRPTDLNLRQGPLEAQQSYQFLREKTPLLSGLGAAIFVSFVFSVVAEQKAVDAEHDALVAQLEVVSQAQLGTKLSDPTKAGEKLDELITGKTGDPMPKMDAFDVMVVLSEKIPKDLTHDVAELDFNRGDVTIKGIVPNIADANTVKDKMAEHECFKDVNLTRTTQVKDKQKYTLEFRVECPGEAKAKPKKKGSSAGTKGAK